MRATLELPATFYAFDLLAVAGVDLRNLPLVERKTLLRDVLPTVGPVRFSDHVPGEGEALWEKVVEMGLEGIVAKRANSTYSGGRSRSWYKIPALRTEDFVVVGFTDPARGRPGFGALHLGHFVGDTLTWAGSVGTGFSDAQLGALRADLSQLEDPAVRGSLAGKPPHAMGNHWVRPELVAEVTFREITEGGRVRHASFLRLRDDKRPEECRAAAEDGPDPLTGPPPAQESVERSIVFTNVDKVSGRMPATRRVT